ncbi:hypothetical protein N7495_001585 [Penicillium taxi]|uniref:uncharacterized protein n=1 Tax=Penicillium taxi TaxID=168475 RepID=UPI0025454DAB|nr:uncharacterized protein N7495_001585 [Penicillium taxi]KAJ5908903.1 hypothetical protein N7495_001585 [Penicillium taxi]
MNLLQLSDTISKRGHDDTYRTSRGAQEMAVSIVFTILATSFVGARLYTRIKLMKKMEGNDWMVVIALINSYIFMGLDIVEVESGMGMHLKDIPPQIFERQMKAFWLTVPFYNAAVLCAKASILMQYFRVFPTHRMRVVCWITIIVLGLYGTWAVLSAFLNCIPVAKFWDNSIHGFCLSKTALWFSNASMHITTDIAILIIPIPALMTIEIPRKQKLILMMMFALGGFVCITSIVRLTSLKKISESIDPTYDNVSAASWSAVECNTGIICACLPTLKPLLSRIMPSFISGIGGSRPNYGGRISTHRTGTWNDDSMFRAPGESIEYGSYNLGRVLAFGPGDGSYYETTVSKDEKGQFPGATTELTELTKVVRHHS